MRVGVIDMGTNSTRMLVAEIDDGSVDELEWRSTVTRLGRGVDTSGRLANEAIDEVCGMVGDYLSICREHGVERLVAIATSAVRDAENGSVFVAELRERFELQARVLGGDEEARLTYLGALAGREPSDDPVLVIDIGGGSTELVIGRGAVVEAHASLQAGVIRHTERHLSTDPARQRDLEDLAIDVRKLIGETGVEDSHIRPVRAFAVAGAPTALAAIDQELDPYRRERVHGYQLSLESIQRMCSSLASKPLAERVAVTGLNP
ncbi:MAG: Ppx/GppA family phosphatase, partial [Solirubrobacterales bacterium]|nr:Ppx/GppA family phosphatase [Solirubrobacterales bacterium]